MVEAGEAEKVMVIDLETVEVAKSETPYLCEIWNWQGDTSVLPFKFESILNSASEEPEKYSHSALKKEHIDQAAFDPEGFFFLTSRSNAIGLTYAIPMPDDATTYRVPYLVSTPCHKKEGVEQCLLALVLKYCQSKGAKRVTVDAPPADLLKTYTERVFNVLEDAGFKLE